MLEMVGERLLGLDLGLKLEDSSCAIDSFEPFSAVLVEALLVLWFWTSQDSVLCASRSLSSRYNTIINSRWNKL